MNEKELNENNKNKKKVSILDIDIKDKEKPRINSPKSRIAMIKLGYTDKDLNYIKYNEYLEKNPNLNGIKKEIKKKRYEYTENKRIENIINKIIEEREKVTAIEVFKFLAAQKEKRELYKKQNKKMTFVDMIKEMIKSNIKDGSIKIDNEDEDENNNENNDEGFNDNSKRNFNEENNNIKRKEKREKTNKDKLLEIQQKEEEEKLQKKLKNEEFRKGKRKEKKNL